MLDIFCRSQKIRVGCYFRCKSCAVKLEIDFRFDFEIFDDFCMMIGCNRLNGKHSAFVYLPKIHCNVRRSFS